MNTERENRTNWWNDRRKKYNIGLIISGILAFILYVFVVEMVTNESNYLDLEITVFTISFQAIGYLIMIGIANLFYNFGAMFEKIINPKELSQYRKLTYNLGFWFSCSLPFLIPIILLIENY